MMRVDALHMSGRSAAQQAAQSQHNWAYQQQQQHSGHAGISVDHPDLGQAAMQVDRQHDQQQQQAGLQQPPQHEQQHSQHESHQDPER